jgi:hypoxanthine phosphoribosyltransferase
MTDGKEKLVEMAMAIQEPQDTAGPPTMPEPTVYLSSAEIDVLVSILAEDLRATVRHTFPHFLAVLDAAYVFAADLTRRVRFPHTVSFVKVSSYQGPAKGKVKMVALPHAHELQGRNVIILDTIVDTGGTMRAVGERVQPVANTVAGVCLLRLAPTVPFGFPLLSGYLGASDRFYVGYGLDWYGMSRNLPHLVSTPRPKPIA